MKVQTYFISIRKIVSALLESGNTNASWNWSLTNFAGENVIQSPVISSDGNIVFGKYYSLNFWED